MKKINFLKGMLVVAILFIANLTVFAGNPGDNLIYNAEEVNGVMGKGRGSDQRGTPGLPRGVDP